MSWFQRWKHVASKPTTTSDTESTSTVNKQTKLFDLCTEKINPEQGIFKNIEFLPDHIWRLIAQLTTHRTYSNSEKFLPKDLDPKMRIRNDFSV